MYEIMFWEDPLTSTNSTRQTLNNEKESVVLIEGYY